MFKTHLFIGMGQTPVDGTYPREASNVDREDIIYLTCYGD